MRHRGLSKVQWLSLGAIIALLLIAVTTAVAQTGGGFDLSWNSIDGGGGASTGGAYSLTGTIGQWDAGAMSGGAYTLEGGFMVGAGQSQFKIYLPLIMR